MNRIQTKVNDASLYNENERIAQFLLWWKRMGKWLVYPLILILILLLAVYGFKLYSDNQKKLDSKAYNEILSDSKKDPKIIHQKLEGLATRSSVYAVFASIALFDEAMKKHDLKKAEHYLSMAQGKNSDESIKSLLMLNQASLLVEQNKKDEAISLLEGIEGVFEGVAKEKIGDIYFQEKKLQKAKDSYKLAMELYQSLGVSKDSADLKSHLILEKAE